MRRRNVDLPAPGSPMMASRRFSKASSSSMRPRISAGSRPGPEGEEANWESFRAVRAMILTHLASMLDEVRLSISYASSQYRDAAIERLILVGGGAAIPGIREYISSALEIEVRTVAPTDVADCSGPLQGKCSDPALTASVGLAQFAKG